MNILALGLGPNTSNRSYSHDWVLLTIQQMEVTFLSTGALLVVTFQSGYQQCKNRQSQQINEMIFMIE
jgi:hypothetical protein